MTMRISLSDCSQIDRILPLVLEHQVGIEIQEFILPENLDGDGALAHEIAAKIKTIPLRGLHGPFFEMVPASRDPLVRQVARSRFQRVYEVAQVVGAQHLILHTGYIPKTYPRETWIENSVEFWVDFLADKPGDVQLHLENVYDDDHAMVAELFDRANEALQRDALSACLDVGHVHANSSKTLKEWIEGLGDRTRYVHLHNNDGVLDDHWGLWKGKIDVARVIDLLIEHAPGAVWMIETIADDIEGSILWLKEKGYL